MKGEEPSMVSIWGLTDKGIVRKENQDSYA